MKYKSSNSDIIYDYDFEKSEHKRYECPVCGKNSKRKNPKDLQYYPKTNTCYCHKCNLNLFEYKIFTKKQDYIIPEWRNKTKLTDKVVKWFIGRMISQNTLNKMKVFSDNEFMPQYNKEVEVVCFPYFIEDKQINIKFRGPEKSFKLIPNAELNWYNVNCIRNNKEIIIVEGEIDALTWIENGFENVISVPNGANSKLEFLDIEMFNHIEKIYLGTDMDTPGIKLRDELIRRFTPERCYLINYKQYKDANDYLCGYNGLEFKKLINESLPVPIKGIVEIGSLYNEIVDLYENGIQSGLKLNIHEIDNYITWESGRLAIVTGTPSSGKSEFIDFLITRLNLLHGWKSALFTPENYPLKYHYRKLHEKFSGKQFDKKRDVSDIEIIFDHIEKNFFYILNEDDMTIDSILLSAKTLVKQKGIKVLVIDPFNKIEHAYDSRAMSETKYIGTFLTKLTNFAKFNDVLVFLIAHPVKMQRNEIPNLYNISGSANFYNQCDYGFIVHRNEGNNVSIIWQKIKFKNLGQIGESSLNYNYNNGRYESNDNDVNSWDNSNWLIKDLNVLADFKAGIIPDEDFMKYDTNEMPF
jgi:twinkle protein